MDAIGKMQTGHSVEDIDIVIDEVYEARGDYESLEERLDDLPSEEDEAEDRAALVEIIDSGAKNIISPVQPTAQSGITITINNDNSVRVVSDGTNAQAVFNVATQSTFNMKNGTTYVLSGCPDGSSSTFDLRASIGGTNYPEYGDGIEFTYNGESTYGIAIVIRAAQSIDVTFKPMVCVKTVWDISQEYQPYRPSYQELYERVVALEQASGTRSVRTLQADPELPAGEDVEDNREEMR